MPASYEDGKRTRAFLLRGFLYICSELHTEGRGTCRFSYRALSAPVCFIRRSRTPVWSVNAPTAFRWSSTGKGGTVFFYIPACH